MRLLLCAVVAFATVSTFASDPPASDASNGRKRAIRFPAPCTSSFEVANPRTTDLAADDSNVYFGDMDGIVWRAPKSGAAPAVVAQIPESWIILLTVDDANVYVLSRQKGSETDSIYVMSKGGGEPRELVRRVFVYELASDGTWLYLVTPGTIVSGSVWNADGRVFRVRIQDGEWEILASSLHGPVGLWLDGETLYFSERGTSSADLTGGIRRIPKSGGLIENVASIPGAMMLHGDSQYIYTLRLTASDTGALEAVSRNDGSVSRLAEGIVFDVLAPLIAYRGSVYFGRATTATLALIEAINPTTMERKTIAEVEGGFPQIAVDECGVYYGSSSGLKRAAR